MRNEIRLNDIQFPYMCIRRSKSKLNLHLTCIGFMCFNKGTQSKEAKNETPWYSTYMLMILVQPKIHIQHRPGGNSFLLQSCKKLFKAKSGHHVIYTCVRYRLFRRPTFVVHATEVPLYSN